MSNEYLMSKMAVLNHIITHLESEVKKIDQKNSFYKQMIKMHLADIKFYKSKLKDLQLQLTN